MAKYMPCTSQRPAQLSVAGSSGVPESVCNALRGVCTVCFRIAAVKPKAAHTYSQPYTQAMARIWRDGQKRSCFVYRLLTCGTIEEKARWQRGRAQLAAGKGQPSAHGLGGACLGLCTGPARCQPLAPGPRAECHPARHRLHTVSTPAPRPPGLPAPDQQVRPRVHDHGRGRPRRHGAPQQGGPQAALPPAGRPKSPAWPGAAAQC